MQDGGIFYPNLTIVPGGNTAGATAGLSTGTVSLVGGANITLSQNGNTLSIVGGGGGGGAAISAAGSSQSAGTIVFSNSNGVSFGMNGSTVTATVQTNYLTTAMASNRGSDFVQATAAFAGTSASGTINSTGISVSIGPYITTGMLSNAVTLSNIRVSGGTTSNLLSALTFGDANGVSFGLNASTMTASHNGLTSQSNQNVTAGNGGFAFQTLSFSNINGISFGTSAGSAITASHNALTSQSNQAFSADASSTFQTLTFQDSNGVSFSNNAGALRVTHALQFTSATSAITSNAMHSSQSRMTLYAVSNTTLSTSNTVPFSALSFQGAGIASVGVSNGSVIVSVPSGAPSPVNFSAGTTSGDLGSVVFSNSNGVSFGLNGSTITASVAAAAGGGIGAGVSTGGNTLGSTGTVTTGNVVFVGDRGITLSQSTGAAGSAATITILGGMITQRLQWPPGNLSAAGALGNGSFSINRMQAFVPMSATRLDVPFLVSLVSSAIANTWGFRVTVIGAIYTKNANTLSSLSSGSTAWSISLASNTAGQTQVIAHAIRPMSVPIDVHMSVGEYYVGFGISTNTSSAGTATTALGNTWSIMGGPIYSSAVGQVGEFTATTNTSTGLFGGQGIYSAAISTVPPTVSLSAINQTGSYYARGNMGLLFRNI